jgi:hypothetical protein
MSHIETTSLCVDHGGDMQIKRMNDAHLGLVIHFLSELEKPHTHARAHYYNVLVRR